MQDWLPARFFLGGSSRRLGDVVAWERATLLPLYGLPLGLEYCVAGGIMELEDHVAFAPPG